MTPYLGYRCTLSRVAIETVLGDLRHGILVNHVAIATQSLPMTSLSGGQAQTEDNMMCCVPAYN